MTWTNKLEDLQALINTPVSKQQDSITTSLANSTGELLTQAQVLRVTGLSFYLLKRATSFPKPIRFGSGHPRYRKSDVLKWYNGRIAARDKREAGVK